MGTKIVDFMNIPTADCTVDDLKSALQAAVELELSTLPPYLCGMWSITDDPGGVANLIRTVVMEEMLHMGLACNMLTAIGGTPQINKTTMPTYPGPLPGGVLPGLKVSLAGLSPAYVKNVYMEIEYPENGPIDSADQSLLPRESNTIGDFYDKIFAVFQALKPTITPTNQISTSVTSANSVFVIQSIQDNAGADVQSAINIIKDQGEGTSTSPEDGGPNDEMAHFYTFSEIYHGNKLVLQSDGKTWQYNGAAVAFPTVLPMAAIPVGGYPNPAENVQHALNTFNATFTDLLSNLQSAWASGGDPDGTFIGNAEGDMDNLGDQATAIMGFALPDGSGNVYGPNFLPNS